MKNIASIIKSIVAATTDLNNIDQVAADCLRALGIRVDVEEERLFNCDSDGKFPSWAGQRLTRTVHSCDYTGRLLDDPELVTYGCPATGYQCRVLGTELPIDILESVHCEIYRVLPGMIAEELSRRDSARRNFGREMNARLKDAGCTPVEVQAWWGMRWKREWSPFEWKEFCTHSDRAISQAMSAWASRQWVSLGIKTTRSFPRTRDAIMALGKARGLSPAPIPEKTVVGKEDIPAPTTTTPTGEKIWSF